MERECRKRGKPLETARTLINIGKLHMAGEIACSAKIPIFTEHADGQDITCTPEDPDNCPLCKELHSSK